MQRARSRVATRQSRLSLRVRAWRWVRIATTAAALTSVVACGAAGPRIDPAPELLAAFADLPDDFLVPAAPHRPESDIVTRFAVVSDLHVLSPHLHDDGPAFRRWLNTNDGKMTARSAELVDATVTTMRQLAGDGAIDFVVVPGDLTANGSVESHRYLASALSELTDAGLSVFVVPGNHDINNPWASSFRGRRATRESSVSLGDYLEIWDHGGYQHAVSRAPEDASYRVDPTARLTLLMVDTARYERNRELGRPETPGVLRPTTREWIVRESAAAHAAGRRIILVHHHALADHSGTGRYATPRYRLQEWESLVAAVAPSESHRSNATVPPAPAALLTPMHSQRPVALSISGHIHVANITRVETARGVAYDISAGAASVFPHPFKLVSLTTDNALHVETRVLTGLETPSARQWSLANYLDDHVVRFDGQLTRDLTGGGNPDTAPPSLSAADRRAMALVVGALSIQHRAGFDAPTVHPEFIARLPSLARGVTLWETLAPARFAYYQRAFGVDPPPGDAAPPADTTPPADAAPPADTARPSDTRPHADTARPAARSLP